MVLVLQDDKRLDAARRARESAPTSHTHPTQATDEPTPSTSRGGPTEPGTEGDAQQMTQGSPFNTAPTHTESTAGDTSPPHLTKDEQLALEEEEFKRAVGKCHSNRNAVNFLCASKVITELLDEMFIG